MNIMHSENKYFEKEIYKFKDSLDKMTDLCENSSILDKNKLIELKIYLEEHQNYLAKNINVNSF